MGETVDEAKKPKKKAKEKVEKSKTNKNSSCKNLKKYKTQGQFQLKTQFCRFKTQQFSTKNQCFGTLIK